MYAYIIYIMVKKFEREILSALVLSTYLCINIRVCIHMHYMIGA